MPIENLARNYVYGADLDWEIENLSRSCEASGAVRDAPLCAAMQQGEFPLKPWKPIYVDFAEYGDKKYMILVDAHSKWIKVITTNRTDAESIYLTYSSRNG